MIITACQGNTLRQDPHHGLADQRRPGSAWTSCSAIDLQRVVAQRSHAHPVAVGEAGIADVAYGSPVEAAQHRRYTGAVPVHVFQVVVGGQAGIAARGELAVVAVAFGGAVVLLHRRGERGAVLHRGDVQTEVEGVVLRIGVGGQVYREGHHCHRAGSESRRRLPAVGLDAADSASGGVYPAHIQPGDIRTATSVGHSLARGRHEVLSLHGGQATCFAGGVRAVVVGNAAEHCTAARRDHGDELQAVQRQTRIVGDPEGSLDVPDARRLDHEGRGGDWHEGEGFRRADQPQRLETGRAGTPSTGGEVRGADVLEGNLVHPGRSAIHRSRHYRLGGADVRLPTGGEQ